MKTGANGPAAGLSGVAVIDKPPGISSFDVLRRLKKFLPGSRIGHGGTLDPFATGVLPVYIGDGTKLLRFINLPAREYEATLMLGIKTDTGDPEGRIVEEMKVPALTSVEISSIAGSFRGVRIQTVPLFSAVKLKGKRLYEYARKGDQVERPKRRIDIQQIEVTGFTLPHIDLRISCSSGTYIRSLAEEVAESLGTVGHLSSLRRTRCGNFSIRDACRIEEFTERYEELLIPLERALPHLPEITVTREQAISISHGSPVRINLNPSGDLLKPVTLPDPGHPVTAKILFNGRLIAISVATLENKAAGDSSLLLKPVKVLAAQARYIS